MKSQDPYGQQPRGSVPGEVYGPKNRVLNYIEEQQRGLASLKRAMWAQDEIVNDATRAAVYRELVADLRQQAGEYRYEAAYGTAGMAEMAERLAAWADYLTKYGWGEKYTVDGEPKAPTLAQKIDDAYIRGGAEAVLTLMSR